jgi:hypothetical protein
MLALCVLVALLLGAAAAVDGQLGVTLLAIWIGMLAGFRFRTATRPRLRPVRLVLGELTAEGEVVGESRILPVVASRRAARVLRSRPRG